jgi:hypothetical protein
MQRRALLSAALALAGAVVVLFGLHQELLATRAAAGSVTTGWGGDLNHTERLLGAVALAALPMAVLSGYLRAAAYLVQLAGAAVAGYAVYAALHWLGQPGTSTGLPIAGGRTGDVVLAAEPYLLVVGGLLLVAAGVVGAHPRALALDGPALRSAAGH